MDMEFSVEDIVLYALEHKMLGAVKYSLTQLQQCCINLSSLCQTYLVILTMPCQILELSSAAELISGDQIVAYSQMLRGLKFIRSNWQKAGGFQYYAFCSIKLQKVIVMHLICLNSDKATIEQHLDDGFNPEAANKLVSSSNNERLVSVLKREISSFRQLCKKLLHEDAEKLKYIQGQLWNDFNKEFWKSLKEDFSTYIDFVKSSFPELKLEKILSQDIGSMDRSPIQMLKSKHSEEILISEEDLIYLLNASLQELEYFPLQDTEKENDKALSNAVNKEKPDDLQKFYKKTDGSKQTHSTMSFYGYNVNKLMVKTEQTEMPNIPHKDTATMEKTKAMDKKRKFVSSPNVFEKPAKRSKRFSVYDAAALVLNSDEESDFETQDTSLEKDEPETNSSPVPAMDICTASSNNSGTNQKSQCNIKLEAESTKHEEVSLENAEKPTISTRYNLRKSTRKTTAGKNLQKEPLIERTNVENHPPCLINKLCNLQRLERPVTRSWQKNGRNLKPLLDTKLVCSSPKANRQQRDVLSRKRKPLSRRKLTYKNESENQTKLSDEPLQRENLPLGTKVFNSFEENEEVNDSIDSDLSGKLLPLSEDEYLSESDCSADDISVNLNLDDVQFPDFTLLPAQQAYYATDSLNEVP